MSSYSISYWMDSSPWDQPEAVRLYKIKYVNEKEKEYKEKIENEKKQCEKKIDRAALIVKTADNEYNIVSAMKKELGDFFRLCMRSIPPKKLIFNRAYKKRVLLINEIEEKICAFNEDLEELKKICNGTHENPERYLGEYKRKPNMLEQDNYRNCKGELLIYVNSEISKANQSHQEIQKKIKKYENELGTFLMYARSDFTKEISDIIAKRILLMINECPRNNTISDICNEWTFSVNEQNVTCDSRRYSYSMDSLYDFHQHRCEYLTNIEHRSILANILAVLALVLVANELPQEYKHFGKVEYCYVNYKDPSGTNGQISYTCDQDKITVKYTAKNGNYVSVKQW